MTSMLCSVSLICLICGVFGSTMLAPNNSTIGEVSMEALFEQFKQVHKRSYHNDVEHANRFGIFVENMKRVLIAQRANPHAKFGFTKFSDIKRSDFLSHHMGLKHSGSDASKSARATERPMNATADPPASMDWRTKGAVSPVKDQANCGSCWTFSITGVVESQWFIKTGTMVLLSEQYFVSCSVGDGCDGGLPSDGLSWAISNGGGLSTEASYPYVSHLPYTPPCDMRFYNVGAHVSSIKTLDSDEDLMRAWVGTHGPLSVGIDATLLPSYHSGIITQGDPDATEPDHAVLVIGYGTENNLPYWIVKNSWGKDWGEEGYFRVLRGKNVLLITFVPVAVFI